MPIRVGITLWQDRPECVSSRPAGKDFWRSRSWPSTTDGQCDFLHLLEVRSIMGRLKAEVKVTEKGLVVMERMS